MNVTTHWRRIVGSAVLVLLAIALCRAATFQFNQAERAFREAASKELARLGITRNAAKAKYPTPYITSVSPTCILPGGTGEDVVRGKFAPGSKFFFENDNLQVVKESLAGGEYRATLKAASGIGPQTANLMVLTPVTAISAQHFEAVSVGGRYEWVIDTANGWRVVARSTDAQPCAAHSSEGSRYEIQFYRAGQSTPFEKMSAKLAYSMWEQHNYRFTISQDDSATQSSMQEMSGLMKKISDPNLSDTERDRLMAKIQKMQEQAMAVMTKAADPAYIKQQQAKREQFGCESIELQVPAGGSGFSGRMRCAPKVGTDLKLTGSMKFLAR
ncbi:MAG: hypothetical protein ABFD89_19680 [Bryobacteraceae bacterium]